MHTVISSANTDRLASPFPICIQSPSVDLAMASNSLLNRYGKSGQPGLSPGFNEIALSFYLFKVYASCELTVHGFPVMVTFIST